MTKYLYGASVQGIQSFIFQTNKLKEIVGASQLVDNICDNEFQKFCGTDWEEVEIIMSAAGNIRCLVKEALCKKIVRSFPKHISNYAPGITISQAVLPVSSNLKITMDDLEEKLRIQRNKVAMPIDTGFMGLERARRTGGVAYAKDKNEGIIDRGTYLKIFDPYKLNDKGKPKRRKALNLFQKFSKNEVKAEDVPFDIEHITKQRDNGWLAIVHADGNGLGNLIMNLSELLKTESNEVVKETYVNLSKQIKAATEKAAQIAFEEVINTEWQKEIKEDKKVFYPFRPVVLGGDDLTVIIRADLAYPFTSTYLKHFEKETKAHFSTIDSLDLPDLKQGLTACAGIAYIKQSYPFHYGVRLVEDLTGQAKTFSKSINPTFAPSSLYFYKVQASFIDDLTSMKKRTHIPEEAKISFDFGPYLIHPRKGKASIADLQEPLDFILNKNKKDRTSISKLRQFAAELHKDKSKAIFMLDRMENKNEDIFNNLGLENIRDNLQKDSALTTIINDLIVLSSF